MIHNEEKILIIDTETIDLNKRFIYDIGFIVAQRNEDKTYSPILEHSFVIKQIYDNKELFHTAYYNKKRPLYTSKLKGRKTKKKHFGHTMRFLEKVMKDHNITKIYAYNSPFDKGGFMYSINYFQTKNIFKNKGWFDIQAIANNFIHNKNTYKNFCKENNFITEKGYLKTNAEITYSFLTNNLEYKEEHTGLEDCKIELDILNECIKNGYDHKHYRKRFLKIQEEENGLE